MCVDNTFFKTKKLQMKILSGKYQIALRKCKSNTTALNAGVLKQQGAMERLIHLDEGFKFLRASSGSPPYFEEAKRDFFAMIRQLGAVTLFCSFSSAETQWIHLLKILGKLLDNKDYCDSELFNQPLYFCAAYPKFSNWKASCYLNQTTVLSLRHPNLPCIYSHKIFPPLIYSTASS